MSLPIFYYAKHALKLFILCLVCSCLALLYPYGPEHEDLSTKNRFIYKLNVLKLNLSTLFTRQDTDRKTFYDYKPLLKNKTFNVRNFLKHYQYINSIAAYYKLDPELIRAVIIVESEFNANSKSSKGALGLMQVMSTTANDMGFENIDQPHTNIQAGSKYLKKMLKTFDSDLKLALAAYNAGPGAVKKHNGIPPYPETEQYVKKVLEVYELMTEGKKDKVRFYKSY